MASCRTSPEFDTIVECTSLLVKSIKDNVHTVGTELYNAKLLSDAEYTTLTSIGSPSSESFIKAVRTVTAVRNKIERNPLLYDVFVGVLTKQGVTLSDCVEEIARNYHIKLKPNIPQIQVTHSTRFLCPFCQKCSVQKFLTTGCTNPCKKGGDTLQFLSLKTSGCIEKDKIRESNFKSEFEEITFLFGELRRLLIQSATNSVQELKILLLTKKVDLMNCNSIDGIICKRTSFFNYDFLGMIITEFGSSSGRKHLRNYLDKFDTYCARNVNEVPFTILHSRSTGSNTLYLALQYTRIGNAAVSLKQIKSLCLQLAKELKVEPWDLQLVSIQEDCVLILSIAKSIAANVFPVSTALLDTLHLTVPYLDLQSKLVRDVPVQDSITSKVFLHPLTQASSNMSEKCEDRTTTENGFDSVNTSLEEDGLISSLSHETVDDDLCPIVEEDCSNGAMSVDTKSRRSKQRTAFKKKADRQVVGDGDWCPSCLRCDYCDRTLPPGQHSIIHQEKPYCNSCYQLLFGQEGFRKGVLMASKNGPDVINKQPTAEKNKLLSKIAEYNMYKQNAVEELQSKEVNGQLLFEGVLKIYWGLKKSIRLSPGVMYAKARNKRDSFHDFVSSSNAELNDGERKKLLQLVNGWDNTGSKRDSAYDFVGMDDTAYTVMLEEAQKVRAKRNRRELMMSLEPSAEDHHGGRSTISRSSLTCSLDVDWNSTKKRSASFRRLSRRKRTEIRMETRHHRYTPPHGQSTNLRVSNAIQTVDVLKMLLAKFKVENDVSQFSLCVFYDNGRKELCKDDDYPLKLRLKLGPSEDIAKLFVIESSEVEEILSAEASEWIKFTVHELETFCTKFTEEEAKEEKRIRSRFGGWRGEVIDALNISQTDPLG